MTIEYAISELDRVVRVAKAMFCEVENGYLEYKEYKESLNPATIAYIEAYLKDLKRINVHLKGLSNEVDTFVNTL